MPVTHVVFAPDQAEALLTVHRAKSGEGPSFVMIWNTSSPGPRKAKVALFCEASVTTCCFPSNKSSMVFAGTEDGTVCVWDLR